MGEFDYGPPPIIFQNKKLVYKEHQQLPSGDLYSGEFLTKTKTREGRGRNFVSHGSFYEGWWMDDKHHGRGRYFNVEDQTVYDGDWVCH